MWRSPQSRQTLGVQFFVFDYGLPKLGDQLQKSIMLQNLQVFELH